MTAEALIEARDLRVEFAIGARRLSAVDGISLSLRQGEIVALVGESGCGKSTTGRAMIRLSRPSSGRVIFDGLDISALSQRRLRPIRHRMQMIFQHPRAALNARLTIARSVGEPLEATGVADKERRARIDEMLSRVGLTPAFGSRYPHELSGGQLQRVAIARALIGAPAFVVADEPLSSLDLSVQAQIVGLLKELQRDLETSLLFITHDLAIAEYISDRVAVMYLGKIVEIAPARQFATSARHPYSLALLSSVPSLDPARERARAEVTLAGEVPSPLAAPSGCRFHTRCPIAEDRCRRDEPPLVDIGAGHQAACWLVPGKVVERVSSLPSG